jgi:two-component system NtrC family sensor kinase
MAVPKIYLDITALPLDWAELLHAIELQIAERRTVEAHADEFGQSATETSVVNVGDVLTSSLRNATGGFGHAELTCEFDDQLRVECNAAQLGEVFVHLLSNAAQAVDDGTREQHGIRVAAWRTADGRTIIEISDTGPGIAPEHLARIFEPFFTTRSDGTGLGLATSVRLVAKWGGTISVASHLGSGARFRVDLPTFEPPRSGLVGAPSERADPQVGDVG